MDFVDLRPKMNNRLIVCLRCRPKIRFVLQRTCDCRSLIDTRACLRVPWLRAYARVLEAMSEGGGPNGQLGGGLLESFGRELWALMGMLAENGWCGGWHAPQTGARTRQARRTCAQARIARI